MVYYLSGTFDCNLWIGSSLTVRLWFAWGSPEVPPRFAYSSLTNRLRFACNSLIPMKFHQRQFVWKTRKLPSNIRAYAKCLASAFNWVSFRDFLTRSRSDSVVLPVTLPVILQVILPVILPVIICRDAVSDRRTLSPDGLSTFLAATRESDERLLCFSPLIR